MRDRVRNRIVLFGALLGALLGLGAAYIFARRQEDSDGESGFSAREAISLGMELVKLLRQIGGLAGRS
tara:strand:+ start:134 stop:337 length:204 start_codon:yes stop_codon:yes gene_type:complete